MNPGGTWPLARRDAEMDAVGSALAGGTHDVIVLHGPAGVGKTRLADACASTALAAGRLTARVVATQSAATMPLGTLAPILPSSLPADATPAALYQCARDDLTALGGEAGLLLLVDDAHLLDTSSAVLLTQLLDARAVTVLATIRDGERSPDAVANWWRRERALRFDLQDLGRDAAHEVLTLALGGAVSTETAQRLHEASGGNPLLLRELVHQALDDDQLDDSSGAWVLRGGIAPSRRLIDVMSVRLGRLSTEQRQIVDQLAVCAPLSPAELSGDVMPADLEALEASGLVRVLGDGSRFQLMLGHPVYGEALRADMAVLRRQAILLASADRIEVLGARRRDDARRVATWRLDAGGTPDTDLLLQAARFARYANDHAQAERLATVLWSREPSVEVAVLLGEARHELGNFEAAEEVLAAAPLSADTPDALRVQWAWTRAVNLQDGLGDWQGALEVGRDARRATGPEFADELVAQEAQAWLVAGEPQKAVDLVAGLTPPTDRGRVLQALVCGQALPRIGRIQEGIEATTEGFRIHSAMAEPVALPHPGVHIVSNALAMIDAGRFDEGADLVRSVFDITVAERNPYAQIFCAVILGRVNAIRGRVREAGYWFREAGSTGQLHGFGRHEHTARCGLAAAEAIMGNVEASNEAAARSEVLSGFAFLRFDSAIGPAWNAWARGFTDEARRLLLESAEEAVATRNVQSAAWLYQDASRMGARGLGSRMVALAESSDSPVVSSLARNVVAREAGDAAGLAAACEELEIRGLVLLAAETAVAAADAYRRDGDQRSATRWSARAKALADRCEGTHTPDLVMTAAAVVPLSDREREVAALAGQGFSSQEIADRLFLSVRTVNNHLGKAYSKLGVTGRKDLAEALGGG